MIGKFKKLLSLFLVGIIVLSAFPMQSMAAWSAPETGTDWKQLSRAGIKARFAVGSDIHVGSGYGSDKKLKNALEVFETIDPEMDAVMFAGDLTDNGYPAQYDTMMNIANSSSLRDKIIWSMGNHEYYGWSNKQDAINEFISKTGQQPDHVYTTGADTEEEPEDTTSMGAITVQEQEEVTTPGSIDIQESGYVSNEGTITIITLGTHSYDGGDYSEQYDFLKQALSNAAAKNPYSPIFVIAHHGIPDSAYTTNEWYGNYGAGTDKDMVALMAQYPQVIHISGHSHATADDPTSIDQSKGFTAIQDASLGAYFENESGKIVSDGKYSTYPEFADEASQALLIDVDKDDRVIIKRMNLTTGKYIYENEPWVIDIPELVNSRSFTYTDDRVNSSKAPVFAEVAQVKVNEADSDSVFFSFSQASAADGLDSIVLGKANDNMVHSYKMKVTNTQTGESIKDTRNNRDYYLRFSDYYRAAQASTLSATITGLAPSTEYKIEVWALTPYRVESSNSISTTFTTAAESNTPKVKAELITDRPEINGNLNEAVWSLDNMIQKDINGNATHNADFDVKWDYDNFYLAVEVKGDKELAAGTEWNKGDIVWIYFDSTLHSGTPYTDGDWQIGIGYNPDDNSKPYIVMGGGVTAGTEVKKALSDSISAAAVATEAGWNAEIAIPWDKLGFDVNTKHELGFDLSVDNYRENEDLEALTWCNANWNDTSGFGKLILSNRKILDVDFSDGSAKDNSPAAHTAVMLGNPTISDNTDLGKKMASFDGDDDAYAYKLTASDYENMKNGFTMECMMKLNEYVNGDPFMNCDGAGLGFELNSDGNTLEFWAHIDGSYVVPSADISGIKSNWVHAAATYDGSALKLYINGELKATETVTGSLDIPKDSAKWVMIGSDTGSDGSVQLPIACDISNARLFGGALNADDIAVLYAKDNPVKFTLSDNNALTGTVGQTVRIPAASARNVNGSCEVSIAVTGPNGENIAVSNNSFTPAIAGTYTITYTARGQKLEKTVTVSQNSDNSGGDSGNNGNNGNSGNSGNNGSQGGGYQSSGSSSSSNTPKTYQAVVSEAGTDKNTLTVNVDNNSGSASVDLSTRQGNIFTGGKTSVIKVPAIPGVNDYSVKIPISYLTGKEQKGSVTFATESGSVTIRDNMVTVISGISGKLAEITIGKGDKSKLAGGIKTMVGDRPLVQLRMTVDGKPVEWNNPYAPVTVSLPYTPVPEELENPESVIIWYIDGNGRAVSVPSGHYDFAAGTVTFTTSHFSDYAVGFNKVNFNDVAANAWYNKAVNFVSARGITTGTGNSNYSPYAKLTRGEFIVMLMRAYDITPDTSAGENFSDAGDTYYTEYLAKAKKSGISDGTGNNLFEPNKEITRQEMVTLMYNALKVIHKLPDSTEGKQLSDFSDSDKIASWAKEAMRLFVGTGTIGGSGGKLLSTSTTTRAEMAQVLYKLLSK